jgi:hypothetical protein
MCAQAATRTPRSGRDRRTRPQQAEHRHGPLGEVDPRPPAAGQAEVGDVMGRQSGHRLMLAHSTGVRRTTVPQKRVRRRSPRAEALDRKDLPCPADW